MYEIRDLLNKFGIVTSNPKLYTQAFTHSSFANEKKSTHGDYERLEFVGDGVLDLIIADIVYNQYKDLDQGQLTKLRIHFINGSALSKYAKDYRFDELIMIGHSLKDEGVNNKILEDVFEAFLGAVYLDQGFNKAKEIIEMIFLNDIKDVSSDVLTDYKSKLQEYVQADTRNSVTYHLISETGLPPDEVFEVEVLWDNTVYGTGKGSSKKKAEQAAAKDALDKLAR